MDYCIPSFANRYFAPSHAANNLALNRSWASSSEVGGSTRNVASHLSSDTPRKIRPLVPLTRDSVGDASCHFYSDIALPGVGCQLSADWVCPVHAQVHSMKQGVSSGAPPEEHNQHVAALIATWMYTQPTELFLAWL